MRIKNIALFIFGLYTNSMMSLETKWKAEENKNTCRLYENVGNDSVDKSSKCADMKVFFSGFLTNGFIVNIKLLTILH